MIRNVLVAFVCLCVLACSQGPEKIQRFDHGVLVRLQPRSTEDPAWVRLEVVSDKIIRVTSSPDEGSQPAPSLMVVSQAMDTVKWDLQVQGDQAILTTSALTATVSTTTGAVQFADSTGAVLLQERGEGGKTFVSNTIGGKTLYEMRQTFDSPEDEAFYGLGQHQDNIWNYKGKDEDLIQHNIEAVIPFVYSTRNYGILWDNYAITRFGDPRQMDELSTVNLFSDQGGPGGLTAKYFDEKGNVLLTRQEDTLDYQYRKSMRRFPEGLANQTAKITWEGSFSSEKQGRHKFTLYASGYYKLWVDDSLYFDRWRQGWNPWYSDFIVPMKSGERHKIKLEWIREGGFLTVKHLDPLPPQEQQMQTWYSEAGKAIDYYFIAGADADDVIHGYRTLTGKAPIMPKWAMGLWQCRERYRTQKEIIETVAEFRKRGVPLDNIVQDWFYWEEDQWGSHEFDSARYPDPRGMVKDLHDRLHAHIMISVWPKFYEGVDNFDALNEKGFLYQRALREKQTDWVGPGYVSTFYDAFNPEARKLYWKQINERLNAKGFDAWWMDATEPDLGSNWSIEERKQQMNPTFLGPSDEYFNGYSLENSRAVYEGLREANPDRRVFILTRSAYAGQQRYASATWSGDVASRWYDLEAQITGGLNFSISGIPYWTHDIGGFAVEQRYVNASGKDLDEWRELMTRWYQFGAFSPLFRVHGQYPYREIYNVAPETHPAYKSMLYYDRLRYRLMPYIYSLAGLSWLHDGTIMRGLVMDFSHDTHVRSIHNQYMFGPSLMVCPVYAYGARSRQVYLPAGSGWYDFYSGKYVEGGQSISADAPYERVPVFVKAGSVVLTGPELQYTGEHPADPVMIRVYGGEDAHFLLFEDDGVSYGYEHGAYTTIPIDYDAASGTLTIGSRTGDYDGALRERTFNVLWISPEKARGFQAGQTPDESVRYNGTSVEIKKR